MILAEIVIFYNFLQILIFGVDPLTTALTTDRKNAAPSQERRSEAYASDAERAARSGGLHCPEPLLYDYTVVVFSDFPSVINRFDSAISENVKWGKRQAMREGKAVIQYKHLYA